MHQHIPRLILTVGVALILSALVTPTAGAGRFGPGTGSRVGEQATVHMPQATCHQYCASVDAYLSQPPSGRPEPPLRPRIVSISDGRFSWVDAAVGFAAASGLALLAVGAILARRHSRVRHARQPA